MSRITWVETQPSGQSPVGNTTPLRSLWTSVTVGLATEHVWSASGGGSDASAGDLLPGGTRTFVAAQSASSTPDSQSTGRLFFTSDTSRLLAYASTGTFLVGTSTYDEMQADAGTGYWAIQTGSFTSTTQSSTTSIVYPVAFLSSPVVYQTIQSGATAIVHCVVRTGIAGPATTFFVSTWSALGASASTFTMFWEATGIVGSASF